MSGIREVSQASYELWPVGERYEYFPVTYLEPSGASNRRILGYDVYYDRVNRAVMKQAWDTRLLRASGKVDLVERGSPERSSSSNTPVYR